MLTALTPRLCNMPGGDAIRWLQSLQAGFRQASSDRSSAARAALPQLAALSLDDTRPSLCEPLMLALPALLSHPEPAVQVEAARTLCQAVRAVPLLGISFLPLIVYHVQRSVARDKTRMTRAGIQHAQVPLVIRPLFLSTVQSHVLGCLAGCEVRLPCSARPEYCSLKHLYVSAEKEEAARVELALLRAIPGMGMHSAALPFVNRALDQLIPAGEPIHASRGTCCPRYCFISDLEKATPPWRSENGSGRGFLALHENGHPACACDIHTLLGDNVTLDMYGLVENAFLWLCLRMTMRSGRVCQLACAADMHP